MAARPASFLFRIPLRVPIALLSMAFLAFAGTAAAAERVLPPGFVEEPPVAPEDPLPPEPAEFPPAPFSPLVVAPDPKELLKACKEATFTDCFRLWRPPPPPPKAETREARDVPQPPPDPNAPRKPPEPGPLSGTPPAPNPAADQATYDALVKALKDSGLDGKVMLPEPPKDGGTVLRLDPRSNKAAPKP
ncbi:hypothetical protein GAY28_05000 [Azospirillum brasilense]|nr:hypothetical protein [Azospirillum brasilense]